MISSAMHPRLKMSEAYGLKRKGETRGMNGRKEEELPV
jgi:hypothetical protein